MATKGFTKINNSIVFDSGLSLEAIGLYIKLRYLSGIKDFKIRRDYVKSLSGYGETAFRRVWKELKDKGVLIEKKLRSNGKYEYEYELLNSDTKAKETIKDKFEESIDTNLSLEDTNEVEIIKNETGFTKEESKQLLKVGKDIKEILKYYRYTLKQSNVRDIFSYTKACIIKKIKIQKENKVIKGIFNNYEQRCYDPNKLERALLYGEDYELPI